MQNAIDILKERGFLAQCTDEEALRKLMAEGPVTFYIGFDPTADSLHAGHFIALMAMSHLQKAGHRPICLVGGGTGTVGDPSGRTDMRKVMTDETIRHNCECFKKQSRASSTLQRTVRLWWIMEIGCAVSIILNFCAMSAHISLSTVCLPPRAISSAGKRG